MDFFGMLFNDPVVYFPIIVIAVTCIIVAYMAYFFIRNINKAVEHKDDAVKHETS